MKEKGVTLIALTITIIVLIISAGVTLKVVYNEGIIEKSQKAVEASKIEEYKENLNIISADLKLKSINYKEEELKQLFFKKLNEQNWIKKVYEKDDFLEDNQVKILTNEGYIIIVGIDEEGVLDFGEITREDGEPYPTIETEVIPLEGTKDEKIKIKVTANVKKEKSTKIIEKIELLLVEGKQKIIKQTKTYNANSIEDEFEVEGNGTYIFKATTNKGKTTTSKKVIINIAGVGEEIQISASPSTPTNTTKNGAVKVKIVYGETKLQKQYKKKGDTNWTPATEKEIEIPVTENTSIVARYFDGINGIGSVDCNVQNIDNEAPNTFNISTSDITTTTNSITIKEKEYTTDKASEGEASKNVGIERYEYNLSTNGVWKGWQTANTFTELQSKIGDTAVAYKVKVKAIDKAGNERESNEISVGLKELAINNVDISISPTTARNTEKTGTQNGVAAGSITVTIKYENVEEGIKKQYKVGNGNWDDYTGEGNILTFTETRNILISARYYDGVNALKGATLNIENVDNEAPNTFNISTSDITTTTNSITIKEKEYTTDKASEGEASKNVGIERYEYNLSTNGVWKGWQTANTFTELQSKIGDTAVAYKVKVKAIDKAGNERESNEISVGLKELAINNVDISISPTTARNTDKTGTQNGVAAGPITVTIKYENVEEGIKKQYKVGNGSWDDYTGEGNILTFTKKENVLISARYYDGVNALKGATYNIDNVDNVAPEISSINATISGAKITVSGTATDTASTGAASGVEGIKTTKYAIDSNLESAYGTQNEFTVSTAGNHTVYMKVIDYAGNEGTLSKTVNVPGCTVTFDANEGSVSPSSIEYIQGATYSSLPEPSRTNYSFAGWYTAKSGGDEITKLSTVPTSDITLFAHWSALKYTVSFNANGGSCNTESKSVTYGSTYGTLPTPTKTGYTFNGWYTLSSGGTQIKNTTSVTITSNQTLYAHWSANTYTVKFNANGGSVTTESTTVTYNSAYGTLPTPIRTGYIFDGWYTSSSGGTKITSTTTVSITSEQTLVAHWTQAYYQNGSGSLFLTLSDAVSNTTSGTITMLASKTETTSVTVPSSKSLTFNTNGKTLTFSGDTANISNDGTLTLKGSGKIYRNDSTTVISSSGTLNIEMTSGTIEGNGRVIDTSGSSNVTIKGGIITNHSTMASIRHNSTGTVWITGTNTVKITGEAKGVITNSKNGTVKIDNSNAEIKGPVGIRNASTGPIEVKAGTIIGTTSYGISLSTTGSLTVTGGTVKSEATSAIVRPEGQSGDITIGSTSDAGNKNSPVIEGKTYGVVNYSGVFTFYGGKIIGEEGHSIYGAVYLRSGWTVTKTTTNGRETAIVEKT